MVFHIVDALAPCCEGNALHGQCEATTLQWFAYFCQDFYVPPPFEDPLPEGIALSTESTVDTLLRCTVVAPARRNICVVPGIILSNPLLSSIPSL